MKDQAKDRMWSVIIIVAVVIYSAVMLGLSSKAQPRQEVAYKVNPMRVYSQPPASECSSCSKGSCASSFEVR